MTQYVYPFNGTQSADPDLLGGKGAGLVEMTRLGLPVPGGFTISTTACRYFLQHQQFPPQLTDQLTSAIAELENLTGRKFGGGPIPLLLSVRSGARFSMPGMMSTVLNLGFTSTVSDHLQSWSQDTRFTLDVHRRFIQMFSEVVLNLPHQEFEEVLRRQRQLRRVEDDSQLPTAALRAVVEDFNQLVAQHLPAGLPADPMEQLLMSVRAVFQSWDTPRAKQYRELNHIDHQLGTAVNVQQMVFGDLGPESGTGVAFTRNPATGSSEPFGEYLPQAQGEDVVAGIRTPQPLPKLGESQPTAYQSLLSIMQTLEQHFLDMCDVEFTIERGRLWILQTRAGKRTAAAAVQIAVDMVEEDLLSRSQALLRVDPLGLEQLDRPQVDSEHTPPPLLTGVSASPGAAQGEIVFSSIAAVAAVNHGKKVILVRPETTPDDIGGMAVAEGMLTAQGGKTSHAAVVARGMGKPAVTGAGALVFDADQSTARVGSIILSEGDPITIDGGTGQVYPEVIPLIPPHDTPALTTLLDWADQTRTLGVRANADTGTDAERARSNGAEGVGLARTEHMFLGDRLPIVQRIILTDDPDQRTLALEELRSAQIDDFESLLEAMDGLPVTIRLLDPPLHEFLPSMLELEHQIVELTRAGEPTEKIEELERSVARWAEDNPMLGLRGVRLGILIPELYRIQIQAALQAWSNRKQVGGSPQLEIMIPLVATVKELMIMRKAVTEEIQQRFPEPADQPHLPIGTMIELPRAALRAGSIAPHADFFSFGTNDLTQMTYGLSRDDAEGMFLGDYLEQGILSSNPFQILDQEGVGRLVSMGTADGKAAHPGLKVGVCGEHGGDPASIDFFQQAGIDYVSCSPPRLKAARLAAAQSQIRTSTEDTSDYR